MATKRARYVGPFDEVVVAWPPGEPYNQQTVTVKNGHWLPADVPASVRDELLAGPDWSEVEQSTSDSKEKK